MHRAWTTGRLQPVHRGVYAVGHARLTRHGRGAAAALAFGPSSMLADLPAAHALDLSTWLPSGGGKGKAVLSSIPGTYEIGRDIPRNEREELMRQICLGHGLPLPRINFPMHLGGRWIEADFYWPEAGLVVEVDGFGTHGTRDGFSSSPNAGEFRRHRPNMDRSVAIPDVSVHRPVGGSSRAPRERSHLVSRC